MQLKLRAFFLPPPILNVLLDSFLFFFGIYVGGNNKGGRCPVRPRGAVRAVKSSRSNRTRSRWTASITWTRRNGASSRIFHPSSFFVSSLLGVFFFSFWTLNCEYSGVMRAVKASHFGAPDAAAAAAGNEHSSSSSSSSLHEESAAGSHLTALHSLLRHRHHHHHHEHHDDHRGEAPVDGAGGGGGISDSGSETASIDVSVTAVSGSPEERRHRHHDLRRLKHLVRRHGD